MVSGMWLETSATPSKCRPQRHWCQVKAGFRMTQASTVIQLRRRLYLLLSHGSNASPPGDDETIDALEERSRSFNAAQYWSTHEDHISTIAHQARAAASPSSTLNGAKGKSAVGDSAASKELVYPNEGNELFYQPSETVSEFLKRCPPHTTTKEETGIHWFWVDNPHKSAHNGLKSAVQMFTDAGDNLLEDYRKAREELEKKHPGMNKGSITKKLNNNRDTLKQQIAKLARETNVVDGKVSSPQALLPETQLLSMLIVRLVASVFPLGRPTETVEAGLPRRPRKPARYRSKSYDEKSGQVRSVWCNRHLH